METSLLETEHFLHSQIPLARAMKVKVEAGSAGTLALTAPLEENHNHLGTAFGGSISALATLAGYTFLWRDLGDPKAHIVIRSSAISYELPIRGEIRAVCESPSLAALDRFHSQFTKAGKARIFLTVSLMENDNVHARFEGEYVAIR